MAFLLFCDTDILAKTNEQNKRTNEQKEGFSRCLWTARQFPKRAEGKPLICKACLIVRHGADPAWNEQWRVKVRNLTSQPSVSFFKNFLKYAKPVNKSVQKGYARKAPAAQTVGAEMENTKCTFVNSAGRITEILHNEKPGGCNTGLCTCARLIMVNAISSCWTILPANKN